MKKRAIAVAMLVALVFCVACSGKNKREFALGKITDGKYTNSFVGVSFVGDDSWDIAAVTDAGEVDYEGAYRIIDFEADNPDEMMSINIAYQQLSKEEQDIYEKLSEKECVKELIASGGIQYGYEQQGFTVIELTWKQVDFLGEKRTAIYSHLEYLGEKYFFLQVIDFKCGEYMTIITMGSYYEDCTNEMLCLFERYE